MMSLFSSFDYFNNVFYPSMFLIFYYMAFCSVIYFTNFYMSGLYMFFAFFSNFFYSLGYSSNMVKGSFYIFVVLFLSVFGINSSSVFSYNFALTAHPSVVLSYSFLFWFSFMMFSVYNNIKGMMVHLVPSGTPMYLVGFMFIIEVISNIIRPLTLMIRLVANIMSGHILLILLCNLVFMNSFFMLAYMGLTLVELLVSLIQSYIITTLLVLYLSDCF